MHCFLQLSRVDVRHRRHVNRLFKQYKCADPFTLRFPHLPSQRGNWVNSKPMSECEPLSRPTWVLGVILHKEAPLSCRKSSHWFIVFSSWITLTAFVSVLNCRNPEPPGFHGYSVSPDFVSTCLQELVIRNSFLQLHFRFQGCVIAFWLPSCTEAGVFWEKSRRCHLLMCLRRLRLPVCVSTPVPKGSAFLFHHCCRGVWHSYPITRNEAVDKSGKGNFASFLCLRCNCWSRCPILFFCFHGGLRDTSPKPFFCRRQLPRAPFANCRCAPNHCWHTFNSLGLFTIPFPHLPSQRGNSVNSKPMSQCECVKPLETKGSIWFLSAGEWCAVLESPLNEDTPCPAVISGGDAFWTHQLGRGVLVTSHSNT